MNNNMFVNINIKAAHEITLGEIRPLMADELKMPVNTTLLARGYADNGIYAGYLFYGSTGPITPNQLIELIRRGDLQETTALNASKSNRQPFIHSGDLSRKELIKWLHQVTSTLEGEETARQRLAALEEGVELCQSWIKKNDDFISANVYPTRQDPIQNQDMLGSVPCKNEAHNRQNENGS